MILFWLYIHNPFQLIDQTASQHKQKINNLAFKNQMVLFAWIEQLFK